MKIAIIASNRKPVPSARDNVFAPGVIIKGLVDNLTEMGHDVTFFGPVDSNVKARRIISEGLNSVYTDWNQIRVSEPYVFMEDEDQYEMVLISRAFEIIKDERDFDIVHAHKYNKEVYFSKFIDTPLVITGHGMYNEALNSPADKIRFKRYGKSCYWTYASEYHKTGVNLNFIGKVPWGVNPEAFPFNDRGGDKLIFISRIIKRKRPDFAIEIARLAKEKIFIAGTKGINPAHIEYWNQIEPMFKEPHVEFLGHVPFDKIYKYFGKSKALLLPIEIGEPLPVTCLESFACGTPVIASNIPPMNELIINGVNGFLVEKDDKEAWIEAIKKIDIIDRKKCREIFDQKYTWRKMTDNFVKIYEKVLEIENAKHWEKK